MLSRNPQGEKLDESLSFCAPPMSWSSDAAGRGGLGVCAVGCKYTAPGEQPNASAERLYADAKADLNSGNYGAAIKTFERVEGRGAGTLLAQQRKSTWRTPTGAAATG